ncbi:Crp/Fnr family transcriptional regulator [Aestuariivirga sp.]|uniref:Crp/Fnr family transcriptional regulator n=1 Tax=Aestuariivirga sp. TaxID=2650926 RepID=UPI003BAC2EFE
MSKTIAESFRAFQLFNGFSESALGKVAELCAVREYGDGELVIGHQDTTFDVFFLLSGKLQVNLYSADGQRVGFHEILAGVMFGEISALDGLPRSASVEASGRCRIAMLPRQRFLRMIEESPSFAMAVSQQLASNVRRLTTRVFEFSTMAVRHRLRAELLRLAERGTAAGDGAVIDPMPTHAELASRISTHREAVSREMAWLDSNGVVAKKGRSLLIPRPDRLRALLEESWDG